MKLGFGGKDQEFGFGHVVYEVSIRHEDERLIRRSWV